MQRQLEEHLREAEGLRQAVEGKEGELRERAAELDAVRSEMQRQLEEHLREAEGLRQAVEGKEGELRERAAELDAVRSEMERRLADHLREAEGLRQALDGKEGELRERAAERENSATGVTWMRRVFENSPLTSALDSQHSKLLEPIWPIVRQRLNGCRPPAANWRRLLIQGRGGGGRATEPCIAARRQPQLDVVAGEFVLKLEQREMELARASQALRMRKSR